MCREHQVAIWPAVWASARASGRSTRRAAFTAPRVGMVRGKGRYGREGVRYDAEECLSIMWRGYDGTPICVLEKRKVTAHR